MIDYTVGVNEAGMRLDRFIGKVLPHLPSTLIQKSLRQQKVRLNGRHQPPTTKLAVGDCVTLYYRPEWLIAPDVTKAYQLIEKPNVCVVYEDEHLVIVNKPVGQSVHEDSYGAKDTLLAHVQAYLVQTGSWVPAQEHQFMPQLCHRIDRNTSGLVIAAKTHAALDILCEKIRLHEIEKAYLCIVHGHPLPAQGTYRDFLVKHEDSSIVEVWTHPVPNGRTAITHYRTLHISADFALLECQLETGRTHQIRAQMAAHGHPLLGDGKYGRVTRGQTERTQALCAHQITFAFQTPAGVLSYLQDRVITLPRVDFADNFINANKPPIN